MGFRLLRYITPGHYHPQLDIGVSEFTGLLDSLQSSCLKKSLVLCSSDMELLLDNIHNMPQILEIYVCKAHFQLPSGVLLLSDYPKVKLVSLNDSTSDWEASAYHNLAIASRAPHEHSDHLAALRDAFNVAGERL